LGRGYCYGSEAYSSGNQQAAELEMPAATYALGCKELHRLLLVLDVAYSMTARSRSAD
jgi:hypothetical protein